MIGPGRPLDTDRYFIICPDTLGATQTDYEHTTSPSNSGLKMKFPRYNERDMVNAQYRLITETLGIPHLLAMTGDFDGGGRESVQFAVSLPAVHGRHLPDRRRRRVDATMTQGRLRVALMRSIINSCKGWDGGDYVENPKPCATNAISMFSNYFYTTEWWRLYLDTPEAYTKWRSTLGRHTSTSRMRATSTTSVHRARASATRQGSMAIAQGARLDQGEGARHLQPARPTQPGTDALASVKVIPNARAAAIDSIAGHAIAGNADPQATRAMGEAMRRFLEELSAQQVSGR